VARADRVPFLTRRHLYAVHATVNRNFELALIVDSGAERMIISQPAAARLGLDLNRPLRLEPLAGVGRTRPMPVVRLDRVQVGSSSVDNLIASVYDLPPLFQADGLLGLDFLRRFRVTFECDTRTLVLRPFPVRPPRPG
jgi:clan AA aspartic protease (TIGR02281 family)